MDQSSSEKEKRPSSLAASASQEQHVSFQSPTDYEKTEAPFSSSKNYRRRDDDVDVDEEEEIDEEEEERLFEQRLHEAGQQHHHRNQDQHSKPTSAQSPGSPPDSMDSNDFVKVEKPRDLFAATPTHPRVEVNLLTKDDEITPSDDVAEPVGEDLRDFASSPQDAAHDLAGRAPHQTFEQFIASTGEAAERVEQDLAALMHRSGDKPHRVAFDDDDEETFRRHGPLTLGQPVVEAKPLRRDTDRGLIDGGEQPSLGEKVKSAAEDAAASVGEFASKISHDAHEGALKAKEIIEHGAARAKETFDYGTTKATEAVEDLLGFEETNEDVDEGSPPRNFSLDQPETPIILTQARPPTPPKPREFDAPETPPVLDLGGPTHPHHYPPSAYQRKPSLKMTPTTLGVSTTGIIPYGGTAAGARGSSSWFDIRRWDRNVLDLIYWRDPKKSGVVFGVTLALLICLAVFNIITVVSYLGLIVLAAALSYRAYVGVMATVQKTEQKNPFQPYLEQSLDLPQDNVHEQVDVVLKHTKDLLHQLRRLFFVEDFCETLKFALLLWALTYVGAYFSGMALIILALVGLFTLPKVYELYQPQIDHYYGIVESKVKQGSDVAREQLDKVPFFKKQQKTQDKQE